MGVTLGANAQVVVDSSFGSGGALNGPNFQIPDNLGKTVGENLFHSFAEFSLQSGQSATFTGPDAIQNILGRVTGSKVSEIDGLIKSEIAGANLYLLNPNGFLFGENAKVDVDGAFTVSARESIKLGEEGSFNAVNPNQSVFTSAAPDAFGFLGENPGGAIKFSGSKLIVENPVGLVGGDIKLEDSVIYAKSEGKPTGVRIEGNNLGIVDSQIRNKSTVEVGRVKQGITIDLKGDLEVTDTTITEEDGSGVDRGDFIDEIGGDVPFASKVGLLGLGEGLSETVAPISIRAKSTRIKGGGVYSVNLVPPDKLFDPTKSSDIEMEVDAFEINHGALENFTDLANLYYSEIIILKKATTTLRLPKTPYEEVASIELYLDGSQVFEGVDFLPSYNARGAFIGYKFNEGLPKGASINFIVRPKLGVLPTNISLKVAGETKMGNGSLLKAGHVRGDTEGLLMDNSRIEGEYSIGINSAGSLSMDNRSLMRSDYVEQGSISLTSGDLLMQGKSGLLGSNKIEVNAENKVDIGGYSYLKIGWDATRLIPEFLFNVYWDSESGETFDNQGVLYSGKTKTLKGITRLAANKGAIYDVWVDHGDGGHWDWQMVPLPEETLNIIDINQPHDYKTTPHIHISSSETMVDEGVFGSQFNAMYAKPSADGLKVEGDYPTSLRIDSKNTIQLSGDSSINGFSQVELTADSVQLLPGVNFDSHLAPGETNDSDAFWLAPGSADGTWPRKYNIAVRDPGYLIIRSNGSTDLIGQSLGGSVVVYAGEDIQIIDTEIRTNDASGTIDWWNSFTRGVGKTAGGVIKLEAEGDLTIDSGDLGITPFMEANRINLIGENVHIKQAGTKNNMGIGIFGSNTVIIDGPTKIEAAVLGNQAITIKAPEVYLNEGSKIIAWADTSGYHVDNKTGYMKITGENLLSMKGSQLSVGALQIWSEMPRLELKGERIILDNATVDQFSYYSYIDRWGEKYGQRSHKTLAGFKTTLINASESVTLINDSTISTSNGDVEIKAKNINVNNSEVVSHNVWPSHNWSDTGWEGGKRTIRLDARDQMSLVDSRITGNSLSDIGRMQIELEGTSLHSSNSSVTILDETKGHTGLIDLDFRKTVTLDKSQIVSISEAQLTTDTNGNNINVKAGDLTMKDSLIGGIVKGDGRRGVTTLDVRGAISLERSHIGGLKEPIGPVVYHELVTDGTIGQSDNLGIGGGFGTTMMVYIPSRHGQIKGDNLYHSFKALDLSSDQVAMLDIPEEVNNVFIRITSGEASLLNGVIESNKKGRNITLINEQGFELGPDTGFDTFSGIRLGAVDAIAFKDGSTFGGTGAIEGQLSDGEAIYEMAPERLTGSIKLFGASLKDYVAGDGAGQSDISLFGNEVDMTTSAVTTLEGADINLQANRLNINRLSGLYAISPEGSEGGDININADDLFITEGRIRTTAHGGDGGDINIDGGQINSIKTLIEANNLPVAGEALSSPSNSHQTGDINITGRKSFTNDEASFFVNSYTKGGTGNLNINAGTFIGDGPDENAGAVPFGRFVLPESERFIGDGPDQSTSTDVWIMAYEGKTGELKINADTFDSRQVRLVNVAKNDRQVKLSQSEKAGYGDITINAKDINLENFVTAFGTKKTQDATTLSLNAENDIHIGEIWMFTWIAGLGVVDAPKGAGTDINFTAKNILSRQDPSKMDSLYYPTIENTGSVRFVAEENLELGVLNFDSVNEKPTRQLFNELKAKNITLGMEVNDESVSAASVNFNYPDNTERDRRTIISATGDVRFLPGVKMTAPALSLSAKNFDANNSEITVGGTFGSELAVQDTLSLRGGSYIESLSPSGKSSKDPDSVSINISSQQLVLEPDSYIVATNHGGDITGNKPIADLNIQSGEISLEDAFISTKSTNAAKAGDLEVAATNIALDEDSRIGSYSFSKGESGDITIGSSRLKMSGGSAVESGLDQMVLEGEEHNPYAAGDSGDIKITSGVMHVEEGSYVRNAQIDNALSGSVSITSDELKLKGKSFVSTETVQLFQTNYSNKTETDQNGSVDITSKVFEIHDSSYVKTTTVIPMRNAGDITIDTGSLELSGNSSLLSNTEPNAYDIEQGIKDSAYGDAGSLEITAQTLKLADRSKISSDSFTSGAGGNVVIDAVDLSLENHSAIYAGALDTGDGGKIEINSASMTLIDKSAVVADVRSSGQGGSIGIKLEEMKLDNSLIFGSTTGSGKGSSITVESGSISLLNGARIESAASGAGSAGELVVQSGIVTITGTGEGFDPKDIEGGETGERVASGLLTSTEGSGDAGTIELKADQLEMQQGLIGSASTGEGAAGSVGLHLARGLSLGQGASVSVSSSQADGGDIEV
ncbi:MAG: filamentous hemagglutinin N-terminal domain-containing protein, partial [Verrucomicrobia bacterium]|nr:filamentous hemagglutinin N-terminal domain-containing protein [Verrucomicrobiota bacterium]